VKGADDSSEDSGDITKATGEIGEADQTPLPEFLTSLRAEFPEKVIVPRNPHNGQCLCHRPRGESAVRGLVCFTTREKATAVVKRKCPDFKMVMEEHSLDSAHEMAKGRGPRINCLILADKLSEPVIHYVK